MKTSFIFLLLGILAVGTNAQESIYDIIENDSCPATEVIGEPELYVGDDLFNLINGGAELYHEFGFEEVLAAEMSIPGADPVKVEIYDMGSPESAWGIYSLTATTGSRPFDAGTGGRHGEGFSQFVKGNYMVYLYYKQLEFTELQYVAGCLSRNIENYAARPVIMEVLETEVPEAEKVIYFKGNLGLSSVYSFHYKDVFGYSEGAAAISTDLMVFLLNYKDEATCLEQYTEAEEFFVNSSKYQDPKLTLRDSFHVMDRKGQQLDCYYEGSFLVLFVRPLEADPKELREMIVEEMNSP